MSAATRKPLTTCHLATIRDLAKAPDEPNASIVEVTLRAALEETVDELDRLREADGARGPMGCRRCVECAGQQHHWLTSMPECPEDGGDPFIPCKHCDARAAICEECFDGPVPAGSEEPLCLDCSSEFTHQVVS